MAKSATKTASIIESAYSKITSSMQSKQNSVFSDVTQSIASKNKASKNQLKQLQYDRQSTPQLTGSYDQYMGGGFNPIQNQKINKQARPKSKGYDSFESYVGVNVMQQTFSNIADDAILLDRYLFNIRKNIPNISTSNLQKWKDLLSEYTLIYGTSIDEASQVLSSISRFQSDPKKAKQFARAGYVATNFLEIAPDKSIQLLNQLSPKIQNLGLSLDEFTVVADTIADRFGVKGEKVLTAFSNAPLNKNIDIMSALTTIALGLKQGGGNNPRAIGHELSRITNSLEKFNPGMIERNRGNLENVFREIALQANVAPNQQQFISKILTGNAKNTGNVQDRALLEQIISFYQQVQSIPGLEKIIKDKDSIQNEIALLNARKQSGIITQDEIVKLTTLNKKFIEINDASSRLNKALESQKQLNEANTVSMMDSIQAQTRQNQLIDNAMLQSESSLNRLKATTDFIFGTIGSIVIPKFDADSAQSFANSVKDIEHFFTNPAVRETIKTLGIFLVAFGALATSRWLLTLITALSKGSPIIASVSAIIALLSFLYDIGNKKPTKEEEQFKKTLNAKNAYSMFTPDVSSPIAQIYNKQGIVDKQSHPMIIKQRNDDEIKIKLISQDLKVDSVDVKQNNQAPGQQFFERNTKYKVELHQND
jgi:hypothetical protein